MSEIDLEQENMPGKKERPKSSSQGGLAMLLAICSAIIVVVLALYSREKMPDLALYALTFMGVLGVFFFFAWIAGLVNFGAKVQSAEDFGETLFDALPDGCVLTTKKGRVVYANKAYLSLLANQGAERVAGIDRLYAGYPEFADKIYRLTQASQDGVAASEDIRLVPGSSAPGADPDEPVWLNISVSPYLQHSEDDDEEPVWSGKSLWQVADVTHERVEHENAFQRLQHMIDYLDHAPTGFFSSDETGHLQYVNATLANWLDMDLAKTTGGQMGLENILSKAHAKLVGTGEVVKGGTRIETHNVDMKTSSGKILPVRILHRVSYDKKGKPLASRSVVLRHDPEASDGFSLDAAEQRLARFFNEAPIGMALIDDKGKISRANAAFLEVSGLKTAQNKALAKLVGEMHQPVVSEALSQVLKGNTVEPFEVHFDESGEHCGALSFGLLAAPELVKTETGKSRKQAKEKTQLVVYLSDTADKRSLEAQFAQSQKMQAVGQLAGGVAHDFNNVLTAIIGFSDLLLTRHRATDPSFRDIMNIKQNANRAANLVRQLLAFSRRQTLRPEVLSLTDALSDLGNLLGRLLGEKVELKTIHARDLGLVKVDLNQLEQVIINLAVNARDAMPEGGVLTVRTSNVSKEEAASSGYKVMPAAEYVLCEVFDTGTGMTEEVLEKIYEPFFSTKEVGKGTGLGLSTVYGIIKQTGGFIFAESEIGKGTNFRIYLPRYYPPKHEKAVKPEEDKQKEPAADMTGQGTILLVEDEEAVRMFASRALTTSGYTVLEAESGVEALERLKDHDGPIDLIISDVVMPEMDGPTLLKELRKDFADIKVIFISGYAEENFRTELGENENLAFLPKPFSLKQLAEAVKTAMSA